MSDILRATAHAERLDELLDQWEDLLAQGRDVPAEELAAADPDLVGELKRGIARLRAVGGLLGETTPATDGQLPPGPPTGRYRPVRLLASGGLGDVFVAVDEELGREVALKRIQPGRGWERAGRARFLYEAEVTAELEHPGVVPVHGRGTDVHGQPYYAMRLIRGQTLNDAIEQFHAADNPARDPGERAVSLRKLLRNFLSLCETVGYAHSRGVLHRDLKPHNVMVGPYGETLLVDWGLAKRIGGESVPGECRPGGADGSPPEDTGPEALVETEPGQVKGTPAYMSPEQAEGCPDRVGTASDVYGLGATLYKLLTGRPPFEGRDRDGVLGRVRRGELLSPALVRPGVPPALQAVCLKAMALRPDDRHAGPLAVASDIEAWLAEEPVSAWREPWATRGRRWLKRHQRGVTVAASALIVLLPALAALNLQQRWANDDLRRANEREHQLGVAVGEQRDSARRQLYLANVALAVRLREEGQIARVRELLDELRPLPSAPLDLRGFEWSYLHRLSSTDRLTLEGHGDWVSCVAFSPDGRQLASSSYDRTVRIWDRATGRQVASLPHDRQVNFLAYAPDGTSLASACREGLVVVWDLAAGKPRFTREKAHTGEVYCVDFDPAGNLLASCGPDKTAKVWDAHTGEPVSALTDHQSAVYRVAFDGAGLLACATGQRGPKPGAELGQVKVWEPRRGKFVHAYDCPEGPVVSIAYSPDGRQLAGASLNRVVQIWEVATRKVKLELAGLPGRPNQVAFSPDSSRLALADSEQTVKVLDGKTGRRVLLLPGHSGAVRCVAFSRDGTTLASSSADRRVKLWDLSAAREAVNLAETGALTRIEAVAFSPDGKRLGVIQGQTVKILDADCGRQSLLLGGPKLPVRSAAFSPDGKRIVTASQAGPPRVWDAGTGQELLALRGEIGPVHHVAFAGEQLVSGGADGMVRVWDVETGEELHRLSGHQREVVALAGGPRPLVASAGAEGTFRVWDLSGGKEVVVVAGIPLPDKPGSGPASDTLCASLNADGTILATGSHRKEVPGRIQLWDVATGRELGTLHGHSAGVNSVSFSPDGRRVVSASGSFGSLQLGEVKLWDVTTGKEVFTFKQRVSAVSVVFSPDGQRVAAAGWGGNLLVWDGERAP